jgi:hypothetical protein
MAFRKRVLSSGLERSDRIEDATKINDPPVSLPRRLRVEPVDQFFSCRVLQLLRLEAAAWKRLPPRDKFAGKALLPHAEIVRHRERALFPFTWDRPAAAQASAPVEAQPFQSQVSFNQIYEIASNSGSRAAA